MLQTPVDLNASADFWNQWQLLAFFLMVYTLICTFKCLSAWVLQLLK